MLKKSAVILFLVCICFSSVYADYPYDSVCPSPAGGRYLQGTDGDQWDFWKCECVSYAAYMMSGVNFSNSYRGASWGNGGHWNDAAGNVSGQNIVVDNYPLPGDIAYWEYNWTGDPNNHSDDYGHVAFVEKVHFNSSGNPVSVDISEYNFNNAYDYGTRNNVPVNNPSGFIHILAYEEGVTTLGYLDCYEMGDLCSNQTHEEWGRIVNKVWNDYRCTNCTSSYDVAFINTTATGFGGGDSSSGSASLPDFIIKKIWLSDSSGKPKTVFTPGEAMQIHVEVKNDGVDTPSGIEVKYYRSNGYKKDSNPTTLATDFINKDDLDGGETHNELKNTTAPTTLGTYNMTAKADSDHDVDEEHEGNNWSDEAAFTVVNTVVSFKLLPFMNSILE
ncbi:MAG: CHAP domain-containing protein [Candidatus Moranbacteria bacterium]|jgi:surface antigen|nr:CHAP domain-containing protein [Candidatus Moranbacteria bacterium]